MIVVHFCCRGNTGIRIVWSIVIVVIMFIVTIFLAMIDSSGCEYHKMPPL